MRIPHALFTLINAVMRTMLRSPLHGLFSSSILAIGYEGIRSGRQFWVPARYLANGEEFWVMTSNDTKWWPNFRGGRDVRVLLRGEERRAHATITTGEPELIGETLRRMWSRHPSDAAYMSVKLHDGEPDAEDFRRAVAEGVLVRLVLHDR